MSAPFSLSFQYNSIAKVQSIDWPVSHICTQWKGAEKVANGLTGVLFRFNSKSKNDCVFLQIKMAEEVELNTDRLNLADFPSEVLLHIFSCLNGTNLLNVSQVCTRFQRIAKEAFAEIYNGNSEYKYFAISVASDERFVDEKERYRPYFQIFGKQMTALNIDFIWRSQISRNHWLFEIIKLHCPSLRHLMISSNCHGISPLIIDYLVPELTSLTLKDLVFRENDLFIDRHYAHLIKFCAENVENLDNEAVRPFLQKNPQLKHLSLSNCCDVTSKT